MAPCLLMLAVSACGTPMRWDKPGATDQMVQADMSACRIAAQVEANRYFYPWGWSGWGWGYGRHSGLMWAIRADSDRFFTETRLTTFCMRNKGYEQVPVQPQTQAPPPPPASPEPPLQK